MEVRSDKIRDLILNDNIYKVILIYVLCWKTCVSFYWRFGSLCRFVCKFFSFISAMGVESISLISRSVGKGGYKKASRYSGQLLTLAFVISLIISILAYVFIDKIFGLPWNNW